MCLKSSQDNKWNLRYSSYSPAFYMENKIRPREWKSKQIFNQELLKIPNNLLTFRLSWYKFDRFCTEEN